MSSAVFRQFSSSIVGIYLLSLLSVLIPLQHAFEYLPRLICNFPDCLLPNIHISAFLFFTFLYSCKVSTVVQILWFRMVKSYDLLRSDSPAPKKGTALVFPTRLTQTYFISSRMLKLLSSTLNTVWTTSSESLQLSILLHCRWNRYTTICQKSKHRPKRAGWLRYHLWRRQCSRCSLRAQESARLDQGTCKTEEQLFL